MNPTDMFLAKKKDESAFITLTDGESLKVSLREIKIVSKAGFGGEEKTVLRLICDILTDSGYKIKNFDNGSTKFAKQISEKGVQIGSEFVITRIGEQTKTLYDISQVDNSKVVSRTNAPASVTQAPKPRSDEGVVRADQSAIDEYYLVNNPAPATQATPIDSDAPAGIING